MRPIISLCMIVRNEEANLPACLATVAGLVQELVIVDTGSTDRTREIAAAAGAKVVDFPWVDDFSAARNEAIRHATGAWIFSLDADDRLDDENRRRAGQLFSALSIEASPGMPMAFLMQCASRLQPSSPTATVVDQVRLFRNHPDIRWEFRTHEQIMAAIQRLGGAIQRSDVVIEHIGYYDPQQRRAKAERNLRLLELEHADRPEDPFVLFNLGVTYYGWGRVADALPVLEKCLAHSERGFYLFGKLYALLVRTHRDLGHVQEALAVCRAGRAREPADIELLFLEATMLRSQGDLAGAEARYRQLLESRAARSLSAVDLSLCGHKARHNLAGILRQQGRIAEAEVQWRSALTEQPDYGPACLSLGELYASQGRAADLESLAEHAARIPSLVVETAVLRALVWMMRRDFVTARQVLHEAIGRFPQALNLREALAQALLHEGRDWAAAEQALRDILAISPNHPQAQRDLAALQQQLKRQSS